MTENEAKQVLDNIWDFVTPEDDCLGDFVENALYVVDSIFEEIQEYRAIGTVEEFKAYKQGNCTNDCKHYDSAIEYVRNKAIDEFTHQLKENLNQEFPSNYESTRPYFSLENARLIVDDVAEQMKAGGKNE